jgi:hypothetical protein
MADKFGFEKLKDQYFKNVMKALDPNLKVAETMPFIELSNLFEVIADIEEPNYETMRLRLDSALKTIKKLANEKKFKGTLVQKGLTKLMASVEKSKLEVVKAEKLYEKEGQATGLVEVDISFNARDYSNNHVGGAKLELTLDSNPHPVKLTEMISDGNARFRGILIEPSGNAHVVLKLNRKVHPTLSQNLGYKNVSRGATLIIIAKEDVTKVEMVSTSARKVLDSKGVKGTVGVDFKIFQGSSELESTRSLEETSQVEVKYTVLYPQGTLDVSQG